MSSILFSNYNKENGDTKESIQNLEKGIVH